MPPIRNKLLAFTALTALVLSVPAHADEDRMPGRMDRNAPRERGVGNADDPLNAQGFVGVEDRSAGANPIDQPSTRRHRRTGTPTQDNAAATPAPAPAADQAPRAVDTAAATAAMRGVEAALPPIKTIPVDDLEQSGLFDSLSDKSLGIDVWAGSSRAEISALLPQIPAASYYKTLRDLTLRALLTQTDKTLLAGGRAAAGEDLLTLRLETLIALGAYEDAARLYALNPGRPYHERLARAGVTAMLLGGQRPLGCIETKAVQENYGNLPFWQQMNVVCDIFLSGNLEKNKSKEVATSVFANSPMLQKVVGNAGYSFRPENTEDIAALTIEEKLAVFTLQRVDYSKLVKRNLKDFLETQPTVLMSLLNDTSLPAGIRMFATLSAVTQGAAGTDKLTAFYDSGIIGGLEKEARTIKGWKQLPALYRQAKSYSPGSARDSVLEQAMNLRRSYGIAALLPFAPFLAESDPGNLTPDSIAGALATMVKAGQNIPDKWRSVSLSVLTPGATRDNQATAFLAYDIQENFAPLKSLEDTEIKAIFNNMPEDSAKIALTAYEKLDKKRELHNSSADGVYENPTGLTTPVDYVMPSESLLSALELAKKDKRLGEVILISSVLLRSTQPGKIAPNVLNEVLDGFSTVGLTKEARELAAEVVLGLRSKKEN